MYFAVWATDRPGMLAARLKVRNAHRARLRDPGEHRVRVLLGGPTLDGKTGTAAPAGDMNGTLLVVEADSVEAVRRYLADDPYTVAGVYAAVEVRPWHWGLGRPDAENP